MKHFFIFLILVLTLQFATGAHYIVGIANDGLDGGSANDLEVVLWNPANGISDNLTDTIGVNGNSGQNNFYLIDCEGLDDPCEIGDTMRVKIFSYPYSGEANATVTGAGFDAAGNITRNSVPDFSDVLVGDLIENISLTTPYKVVYCSGIITEYDGETLSNISAEFFDNANSFFGDSDNSSIHHTNNSCFTNSTYGDNQTLVNCSFEVFPHANYGEWNCTMTAEDNLSAIGIGSDLTNINTALFIEVNDSFLNFGNASGGEVTNESIINITNLGNVIINLSLSGFGNSEGDGYSMVCEDGEIPIDYMKYNLTSSTSGDLSLSEFENHYINLTSAPATQEFNLGIEETKSTFWRVYVPNDVSGGCGGNITIGATLG